MGSIPVGNVRQIQLKKEKVKKKIYEDPAVIYMAAGFLWLEGLFASLTQLAYPDKEKETFQRIVMNNE